MVVWETKNWGKSNFLEKRNYGSWSRRFRSSASFISAVPNSGRSSFAQIGPCTQSKTML